MNIIRFQAQMGNQMFQYALYLAMKNKGIEVCLDDVNGEKKQYFKKYFLLKYDAASRLQLYFSNIKIFILNNFRVNIFDLIYFDKENGFDENVFKLKNKYIIGYWQNEKYFSDEKVITQLKNDFKCPKNLYENDNFVKWEQEVSQTNSVAIHYRRTDYLKLGNEKLYGNICTSKYYEDSINYISSKEKNLKFFLFSDDKKFLHENFDHKKDFIVVDDNLSDLEEFFLMSKCKHMIMANSTFSWWAGWLNENKDAIICAPEKWNNIKNYDDIYTDRMIKISIK